MSTNELKQGFNQYDDDFNREETHLEMGSQEVKDVDNTSSKKTMEQKAKTKMLIRDIRMKGGRVI